MVSVVCLVDFHYETRQHLMIAEGLLECGVKSWFNQPVVSLGKTLAPHTPFKELKQRMADCDYILVPDFEHFGGDPRPVQARPYPENITPPIEIWDYLNDKDLWYKVAYYDMSDGSELDMDILYKVPIYFKRVFIEWVDNGSPFGKFEYHKKNKVYPLPLCVLDAYLKTSNHYTIGWKWRPIDIGYYFNKEVIKAHGLHYTRRAHVWFRLAQEDWSNHAIHIGIPAWYTGMGWNDPVALSPKDARQDFIDYIKLMASTKIVFDALPTRYTQTHRPWEAIASGAVCFFDKVIEEILPNPFEHGKHCFFYDATDVVSIKEAISTAKSSLDNKSKELETIARKGYDHAIKYHRSVNRVDYMLSKIKEVCG